MRLYVFFALACACGPAVAMEQNNKTKATSDEEILLPSKEGRDPEKIFQMLISSLSRSGYFDNSGKFAISKVQENIFWTLYSDHDYAPKMLEFINSENNNVDDDNHAEVAIICGRLYFKATGFAPGGFDDLMLNSITKTDDPFLMKILIDAYKFMLLEKKVDIDKSINFACKTIANSSHNSRLILAMDIIIATIDDIPDRNKMNKIKEALASQNMAKMLAQNKVLQDKLETLLNGREILATGDLNKCKNQNCIIS